MNNKKLRKLAIICILILILIVIFMLFFNPFLHLSLKGKKIITVEVNESFKDPLVNATFFGKDVSDDVSKTKIKADKIGRYTVEYKLKKGWTVKKVKRTVEVVDTTKPEIALVGNTTVSLKVGESYVEPGFTATDNYDGDLTDKVKVKENVDTSKKGEYKVTYTVEDSSHNKSSLERTVIVENQSKEGSGGYSNIEMGPKYIDGILIVNKQYALPKSYGNGVDPTAQSALSSLQAGAKAAGFSMPLLSGYRSYQTQVNLYQRYVNRDGQALADTYSARAGHSEHQTGLAFDVGSIDDNYGTTPAGKWLVQHCAEYGFILRYPKGKEYITGYQYEPWHIRYVGKKVAKEIMNKGITLEEYLGVA